LDKFIAQLGTNPVSYLSSNRADVITNYDILLAIFRPIYSPLPPFPS
jgi:hypothetical protein